MDTEPMSEPKGRSRAIAALYRAGMGQLDWGEALAMLADHVGARGITLDTYDFDASVGTVLASNMAPDPAISEYNEVYGHANPLIERTRRQLRRGRVFRASDFVPTDEFIRTELYNTVYRKLGIKHVGAISIRYHGSRSTQLSVLKPADADDFSRGEMERLAVMQAHVRQAWAGHRELMKTQRRLDELTSLWNLVEVAVIVVDEKRQVQFANRAAEDLLRSLPHNGSAGTASSLLQQGRLTDTVDAVLEDGGIRHAGELGIPSSPGLRATVFGLGSGKVAVLITDPLRHRDLPLSAFRQRFELTEAEARVVQRITAGNTIRQTAVHIGIGYETARSQLKSAMAKNGWRRQSEMLAGVFGELLPFGTNADGAND
jgi:DNA-binding CsgD family transcriptional regulator/PAS domain-containing protein